MPKPDEDMHGHGFERANICAKSYEEGREHELKDAAGTYSMGRLSSGRIEAVCNKCKGDLNARPNMEQAKTRGANRKARRPDGEALEGEEVDAG